MRLFSLISTATILTLSLLSACHVEHHGGKMDWDGDDIGDSVTVCSSFCGQLLDCGNINAAKFASCISTCQDDFTASEKKTRSGCKCVVQSSCKATGSYACEGAPLSVGQAATSVSTSSSDAGSTDADTSSAARSSGSADAGSSADSAASSSSAGASAGASGGQQAAGAGKAGAYICTASKECAWSEDCVLGYCLTRCKASCECHTGESCIIGYCSLPVAPPKSCNVDCECPAGGKCTAGVCK